MVLRIAFVVLVCILPFAPLRAETPKVVRATDERHFVEQVLPLLKEKCLTCHGNGPEKIKGGLDLRTRKGLTHGGESGKPAIQVDKPLESPLWLAINRKSDAWSAMPPKENDRLSDKQLAAIRTWIDAGAPWPSEQRIAELKLLVDRNPKDGVTFSTSGGLTPEWTNRRYQPEDLWAFRNLLKKLAGPSTIDEFIDAQLNKKKLTPAPPVDRRTLIRRVTFDLIGLPPTPREIDEFTTDPDSDDRAFAQVVDRLLASPHYGERMAQHWLDVTRYADSAGGANDYERGNAWRYRDYVVRSFNADKPYDQFVREQLAGDEIDPKNPEALIATGFLRMGPWELTGMEVPKVARQRFLDDVTDSVGQTFLGQPLQCARCHDHKFDPIPTRDYYSIQAVFATLQMADRQAAFLPSESTIGFDEKKSLEQRRSYYQDELNRLRDAESKARDAWAKEHPLKLGEKPPREKYLTPTQLGLERIARKGLERLTWRLDRYEPIALSVYNGATPDVRSVMSPPRLPANPRKGELESTAILVGGDPFSPADGVQPGVLSAANGGDSGKLPNDMDGRRRAFADWVASPSNPLTARVMVNRLWAWHFGNALAGNPNNFGATGKKPTQPELLDWLAVEFVNRRWSVKEVHRMIVMSNAYRRSARHPQPAELARLDPQGTSYAAFKPRRLSAEEIRDAILASTGELTRRIGGIPCRPEMNAEVAFQPRQVMGTFAESWQPNPKPEERHRRSLYILKLRGLGDPAFTVFDQPSPESSCELRNTSIVASQAFTLFNSDATYRRAIALAAAIQKTAKTDEETLRAVFVQTLGRLPSDAEFRACEKHWKAMTERHEKLNFDRIKLPGQIERDAVEENTGERFRYTEPVEMASDFVADLQPADCSAKVRGLAEVCLVLFNTNEFLTLE